MTKKEKLSEFIDIFEGGEHFDDFKLGMVIYKDKESLEVINERKLELVDISEKMDKIMHKIYKAVTSGRGIYLNFGDRFEHKLAQALYDLKTGSFELDFSEYEKDTTRKVARGSYGVILIKENLREENLISESEISYFCNLAR